MFGGGGDRLGGDVRVVELSDRPRARHARSSFRPPPRTRTENRTNRTALLGSLTQRSSAGLRPARRPAPRGRPLPSADPARIVAARPLRSMVRPSLPSDPVERRPSGPTFRPRAGTAACLSGRRFLGLRLLLVAPAAGISSMIVGLRIFAPPSLVEAHRRADLVDRVLDVVEVAVQGLDLGEHLVERVGRAGRVGDDQQVVLGDDLVRQVELVEQELQAGLEPDALSVRAGPGR